MCAYKKESIEHWPPVMNSEKDLVYRRMLFKGSLAFLLLSISVVVCATNETQHEGKIVYVIILYICNSVHFY